MLGRVLFSACPCLCSEGGALTGDLSPYTFLSQPEAEPMMPLVIDLLIESLAYFTQSVKTKIFFSRFFSDTRLGIQSCL